jgi:AcrR family transcriptional regulator
MSVRLPASERREQLLAVALAVFAREGFHGTAMSDVADAAGVTKPVLYQHFRSKRELYLALLDEVGLGLRTTIAQATSAADSPHTQVQRGFAAWFGWVAEQSDGFRLLFGSGNRRDVEFAVAVRHVEDALAGAIAPLIRAGLDPVHQQTLAWALVGMAETTARRLVASGEPIDAERVARQVSDLAWAGLRGLRPV